MQSLAQVRTRGALGGDRGAAIAGITPTEASLEVNVLTGAVPLLAPLEGQVVGEQGQQHELLAVPPSPPCVAAREHSRQRLVGVGHFRPGHGKAIVRPGRPRISSAVTVVTSCYTVVMRCSGTGGRSGPRARVARPRSRPGPAANRHDCRGQKQGGRSRGSARVRAVRSARAGVPFSSGGVPREGRSGLGSQASSRSRP